MSKCGSEKYCGHFCASTARYLPLSKGIDHLGARKALIDMSRAYGLRIRNAYVRSLNHFCSKKEIQRC